MSGPKICFSSEIMSLQNVNSWYSVSKEGFSFSASTAEIDVCSVTAGYIKRYPVLFITSFVFWEELGLICEDKLEDKQRF